MPPPTDPPNAVLLRDYANTEDVETGADDLPDPAALADWLRERDLLASGTRVGADDLALALTLRRGLRTAMAAHHDGHEGDARGLAEASERLPLALRFGPDGPELTPAAGGVRGALGALLVAVSESVADGSWPRLKLCRASDCQWAFLDASKNRSRSWCAMGVCGNRQKTRRYRARQRNATT
ncbi:MAG: CGNR zinc finger domain-containing protein [Actinomycetes bacterium]